MAEISNIAIGIDSTGAKSGSKEIVKSLQDIRDAANSTLKSIESQEGGFDKLKNNTGILQTLKNHWMGVAAGVASFTFAMKAAWDMMVDVARETALVKALDIMLEKYKITGDQITLQIKKMSRDTISYGDAAAVAAKGIAMGLDPAKLVDLAKYAKTAATIMGVGFEEAVEKIEQASMTGAKRATRALGIVPDFKAAIDAYQYKVGKYKESMDQDELAEARMNAILDAMKRRYEGMPQLMNPLVVKQQQLTAAWKDAKDEAAKLMLIVAGGLYDAFQKLKEPLMVLAGTALAYGILQLGAMGVAAASTTGVIGLLIAAIGKLNLAFLKSPLFWIAAALGFAAAQWYKQKKAVEDAKIAQDEYNASFMNMPEGRLDAELVGLERKAAALAKIVEQQKALKAASGSPIIGKFDFMVPTKSSAWGQQEETDLLNNERILEQYRKNIADALERKKAIDADKETKELKDSEEKQKDAIKAINEQYLQMQAAQARTEKEYTDLKIRETEARYSIHFAQMPKDFQDKVLEINRKNWVNSVEKAMEEVRLRMSSSNRQLAADMDAALQGAGLMDEGTALSRKFERDTAALQEAINVQRAIVAKKETPQPERIKAGGEAAALEASLKQKPVERMYAELALFNKTVAAERDLQLQMFKDVNAQAVEMNRERVQAGLMTEADAIRERNAMRMSETSTELINLSLLSEQNLSATERMKIDAAINKILLERQGILKKEPLETARADVNAARTLAGKEESRIAIELQKIETDLASYQITAAEAEKAKIPLLEEQLRIKMEYLEKMPKGSAEEVTAWNQQKLAIDQTSAALINQKKLVIDRTATGGAVSAMREYADVALNTGQQIRDMVTTTFKGMEDALFNFVKTGKLNFRELADSIIDDMIRIMIQQSITGPLAASGANILPALAAMFVEKGAAFDSGSNVIPFRRGGVVSQPSVFRFAKGTGMMAEGGIPEAIMPLARLPSGDLGVKAAPQPQIPKSIRVEIKNESPTPSQVKSSSASMNAQELVISMVIDGLDRNVGGLRTRLGGS